MKKIIKRFLILKFITFFLFSIIVVRLFYIQIIRHDYYKEEKKVLTEKIVKGSTAPRGRIYDRNNILIVDNEPVKIIYYEKKKNITFKEEKNLAYKILKYIDITPIISENELKDFYMKDNNEKVNKKITKEEYEKYKNRIISDKDLLKLKKDRITSDELKIYNKDDIKAIYIYNLMNKGYSYEEKIIKIDPTDREFANIASSLDKLEGFNIKMDWKRIYPYGITFRSILGNVSDTNKGIPQDLKEEYLKKGYNLNDRVGISYLEYQYDDYLKGEKNEYKIVNNEKKIYKEGKKGNDIVLTIDIELQKEIENILEEELMKTKKEQNTKYFDRAFVILTNPRTGEILSMSGKQIKEINNFYSFYDYTPGAFLSSVTAGSVVKGASHIVGYNNNGLNINEVRNDICVKLSGTNKKCSWKSLGTLNDITALKKSSNTYQYYTALKVANLKYRYNMSAKNPADAFRKYRDTFNEFGLGVKTEIDLPLESIGNKGKNDSAGLLLDFSIGQYDTYTPLELSQYISTIANNGSRMKFHLIKKINNKEYKNKELNKVNTSDKYIARVKEGFKEVLMPGGTGYNYIDLKYKPAGKTGTSESFIDTDNDLKIDKETISTNFVGFAPFDNPEITFTVVTPNIYYSTNNSEYQSNINRRIVKRVSEVYFKKYGQK